MEQALRDPIWQFVGVLISIVALVVAIVAIRYQNRRKSLSYVSTTDFPVFHLFDTALKGRLAVSLDGEPVRDIRTFEVVVFNDGDVPILASDFVEPITVTPDTALRIIAAGAVGTSPSDVKVDLQQRGRDYVLSMPLLNPGDQVVVQFLLDSAGPTAPSQPKISGRIAGVSALVRRKTRPALRYRASFWGWVIARNTPFFILGVLFAVGANAVYNWLSR